MRATRYRLVNTSRLSDEIATELVEFAFAETPTIENLVAVKIGDGNGAGRAYNGQGGPRWMGRASFGMRVTVPGMDDDSLLYGSFRVSWYSTELKRRVGRRYDYLRNGGGMEKDDAWRQAVVEALGWVGRQAEYGRTKIGRWPIYRFDNVFELTLHTLAHEAMHVLSFDRQRTRGRGSEVLCEEHAARVLEAWRRR
jgi:hypothetical protein